MGASEETIRLLRSIDASLKSIDSTMKATGSGPSSAPAGKAIADDRDLDSQYGDPLLKFMPRDWTGPSFKDRHFSECPADLLDMVAETFDYFATKAEENKEMTSTGKPVAPYKRKDAARARGWAKRVREGKIQAAAGSASNHDSLLDSEWPTL